MLKIPHDQSQDLLLVISREAGRILNFIKYSEVSQVTQ